MNQKTPTRMTRAADLKTGDVVAYNSHTSWRLGAKTAETEKTVTFALEIIRSEHSPEAVGRPGSWRFRKGTVVDVVETWNQGEPEPEKVLTWNDVDAQIDRARSRCALADADQPNHVLGLARSFDSYLIGALSSQCSAEQLAKALRIAENCMAMQEEGWAA